MNHATVPYPGDATTASTPPLGPWTALLRQGHGPSGNPTQSNQIKPNQTKKSNASRTGHWPVVLCPRSICRLAEALLRQGALWEHIGTL